MIESKAFYEGRHWLPPYKIVRLMSYSCTHRQIKRKRQLRTLVSHVAVDEELYSACVSKKDNPANFSALLYVNYSAYEHFFSYSERSGF